jgi:hypothetical protein
MVFHPKSLRRIFFTFIYQNTARISLLPHTCGTPRTPHPTQHSVSSSAETSALCNCVRLPRTSSSLGPSTFLTSCCLAFPRLRYSLHWYANVNQTPQQFNAANKSAHLQQRNVLSSFRSAINVSITSNPVLPVVSDSAHLDPPGNILLQQAYCQNQLPPRTHIKTAAFLNPLKPSGYCTYRQV